VSVISQYVGLHFRKVYEQGCDLQMVSATSPAGQWMLKEIFRYITREGGRLAARVQEASVWSSAAQRPVDFRRSDDNSLPGGGTPTKATGSR
jgi:hypothetical protein